jgi:uncharacterized membrane protein YkvA (DUF1232 family)
LGVSPKALLREVRSTISKKDEQDLKKNVKQEFEKNQYEKWESKAKEYAEDKSKAAGLLQDAMKKAEGKKTGPIGEIWEKLQLLFSILKDWLNGSYKDISKSSITIILLGLLYFVMPVDIVPDWIISLGFLDDAAVLGFIINQVNQNLEEYKVWKSTRK